MTDARRPRRCAPMPAHRSHHQLVAGLGALLLAVIPSAGALYLEGEAPAHPGSYLQADVAPAHDPLSDPLHLTMDELANVSSRAADAARTPGTLLPMTPDDEAAFATLQARLDAGGHDGVLVNGTGYRFAIAMAEILATGPPQGEDTTSAPTHEPTGNEGSTTGETGEASGVAIGTMTLLSAGAMYWVRRLR